MEQAAPSSFFVLWAIVPLAGFVAAMTLVGLKRAEPFFPPLWSAILLYNTVGAALFALGFIEVNLPGAVSSRIPVALGDSWRLFAYFFFLFPLSLLVTLLRFPSRKRKPALAGRSA